MIGTRERTEDPPVLKARGMGVRWDTGVQAVRGVDLTLNAGEVVGVVGESGSGKTSLVMGLLGLVPLSDGEVWFRGQSIRDGGPELERRFRSGVQPVFQIGRGALNPARTVAQTLEEVLRFHATVPASAIPMEVEALMEQVGLPASLAHRRPTVLSGGERQRVSIARALAVRPQALILDEPTSALDVSVQAGVMALIREIIDEKGLAVLLVSHDLALVGQFCSRVHVMLDGQVVESGASAALFAAPAHPFTRALMEARRAVIPDGARGGGRPPAGEA